ncbi:hypothetical protein RHMOL_Rhmol02G0190200 [Rhododendron molle]|uniref:Uncharacterized protein n=1 Tax=Rhododendron molle TaxID=49168 RepID=A0ACC0PT61_RHOML|nr:hypothetical protein RHMOL_Rhmol02G0190200 [Rhododendron molle]
MADHGNNGIEGEVVDRSADVGGPMETDQGDQKATVGAVGASALATGGGNGREGQQQEVSDGDDHRAIEVEPRAIKEAEAVGSSVEPVGPGIAAEGTPKAGGSLADVGGSGAMGADLGLNGSPPRDPARGKGAVIEEEETTEAPVTYREEDVLFWPTATSSSHIPITKYDVAEHLPDEALAKLLEDNPIIGEIVLEA